MRFISLAAVLCVCTVLYVAYSLSACSSRAIAGAEEPISSFEECVKAGHGVLRSYPPQCVTPDGKTFSPDIQLMPGQTRTPEEQKICVDRCGDGTCQEIVCMGEGCPCPESQTSCPRDCPA